MQVLRSEGVENESSLKGSGAQMKVDLGDRSKILILILLVGTAGIGVPGCGDPVAPVEVEPTTPRKTAEELAQEQEQRDKERLETRYQGLSKAVRTDPERFDDWISHLEDLIYASEGTSIQIKAKKLLEAQLQFREDEGQKSLDQMTTRVEALVEEGDPLAAENILEGFDPDGMFEKTAAFKGWQALKKKVAMRQAAEVDFDRITRRARAYRRQEELAQAIGLLESFSDEYKGTQEYAEVVETIQEYLAEYVIARAAIAEQLAIEWIDLEVDQYLSSFRASATDSDATVWSAEDGEVVGNNETSGLAQLEIGDDLWEEYSVEMEIQLVSGDQINLGITAGMRPGAGVKNYDVHGFESEKDEWLRIRIELKEGLIRLTDLDSLERLDDDMRPYFAAGGIAVLLRPDESVRLRNVRYKVFRPVPGEEPDPDGAEEESEG